MPHIALPEGAFGITGPMQAYPETGVQLNALAEAILRGPSSLTQAERELIASHVSSGNECCFCTSCHAAAARHLYGGEASVVDAVLADLATAPVSPKMRALLVIAGKVRQDGRTVSSEDVAAAKTAGADDKALHDTVLVAAAFCMFNRYVDGLATIAPADPQYYQRVGEKLATQGYVSSIQPKS